MLSSCSTGSTPNAGTCRVSAATQLAQKTTLQAALMVCAVELTSYCISGAASFPAITTKLGYSSIALDLWEAIGHFLHYLPIETSTDLPDNVSNYLLFMRVRIAEQLAWKSGSSVYQVICEGGGGSDAAGHYRLLSSFLNNVAALAKSRCHAKATVIACSLASHADTASFMDDCDWLMMFALEEHLHLLFGQHLSFVVACCVYSIVRVHHGTVLLRALWTACCSCFRTTAQKTSSKQSFSKPQPAVKQ